MASIVADRTVMTVRVPGTKPTITADPGPPAGFAFDSPSIDIDASIRLSGHPGESVAGWTLGFVQLKYIGTDHARYRGATVRDGSALVSSSNRILCRDTDIGSTEIWYDSFLSGGTMGPTGTNRLGPGTVLPASGILTLPAHLFDQPSRGRDSVRANGHAGNRPNYLHYAVAELLFCTMLVAQEPGGRRHMLRHLYWNVIWEHKFRRNGAGAVVAGDVIRLQHNIQPGSHGGNPRDPKFMGKEYDLTLPVSNTVSRRTPRVTEVADWSQG